MLLDVRGKTLSVETQGSGEPVVLVHGLGSTANVWEPQVRALADRFTVVRYDLEGAGRSPFSGALSIDGWVQDLKALLDMQRIAKARLIGHSLGSLILQHFAVAYPQQVEKLVFIGVNRAPPEARRRAPPSGALRVLGGAGALGALHLRPAQRGHDQGDDRADDGASWIAH